MIELMPLIMFTLVCIVLMMGYPVAFSLSGTALACAGLGVATGHFDEAFLSAMPSRLYGIMNNQTLMAVPLFVLMGIMLEKSKVAEDLLDAMALLFGRLRGGLGISVTIVGMLLAASTGIVGATVVTMGVLSLPTMLKRGYSPAFATGTICATGTLGQIIPPSIALVLLGDVLSSAYQQAQLRMGVYAPKTVSVGDLFAGAMIPGLILVFLYVIYVLIMATVKPEVAPLITREQLLEDKGDVSDGATRGCFTRYHGCECHGLYDLGWCSCIFVGVPWLWGRRADPRAFREFSEWSRGCNRDCYGRYLFTRIYSRLYRDHVRRGSHCRSGTFGNGPRPGMAWCDDRSEPANLVSYAAVWFCTFLFTRGGAGLGTDLGNLSWGSALRFYPDFVTGRPGVLA